MLITFLILFVVLVPGVCCERPCRAGLYGQLCDKPCDSRCRPRANKNTYCDKVTGTCLEGCVPGWCGDKCNIPCSNNCIDHVCYQQTGQCAKGCKGNYKGDMCNEYEATENPSTKEPKMLTDLHDASYWGDLPRVKGILSDGQVNINCVDYYGRTPLMWAALQNQKEVFDFLVKKEADVSLLDKSGNNLLHGGDKDILQSVLSRRLVNINSGDKYGRTAVMMAANGGHRDVFDLLVTNNADLTLVDSADNTVLHVASLGGHIKLVEDVLSHNIVNINARNKVGKTAAMLSKENGHTPVYDLLLSRGCAEN